MTSTSTQGAVASDAGETAPRSTKRRNLLAIVASVILIAAFVWLLTSGGFPLLPPKAALAKLETRGLVLFSASMLLHFVLRYARCHYLIAPLAAVPFRRIMTINAIGMALITYLPLRIGEMARPAMLREKGSLSAWAVTGTVGAERIIDGIVYSLLLLLGLALAHPQSPLPDHVGDLPVPVWVVPRSASIASLAFVAAFIVMCAFYFFRSAARKLTERVVGLVSPKLGTRLADIIERFSDGMRFLTDLRHSIPYLVLTLISVGALGAGIEVLAHAAGMPELSFAQSMVVLGVVALGFTAPNAPGFFGVVQLALYAGLATYISPEKVAREGAVVVFVYYVAYLITVSGLAALALLVELVAKQEPAQQRSAA